MEVENQSASPGTFETLAAEFSGRTDVQLLVQAVLNERNAPDILEFKNELLTRIFSELRKKEEYIEDLEHDRTKELQRALHSTERDRIRYLLKVYHRTRLRKIEDFAPHILDDPVEADKLSPEELEFAQQYFMLVANQWKELVLNELPSVYQSLVKQSSSSDTKDMIFHPELDQHVYCEVVDHIGDVPIDEEGQTVEMEKGDLYIINYKPITGLLSQDRVCLI